MTKRNKIKPNTSSHLPSSGMFLLGRLAVLVPTSLAPFPALRTRPFGSTFRLPPHRPRPSPGRATPAVQMGGRGRAEQRTPRTSRGPPGVQPPSGPRGSGPERLWRVSASQMCVAPPAVEAGSFPSVGMTSTLLERVSGAPSISAFGSSRKGWLF